MRVLAISGSLRAASSNSAILRAAVRVSPPDVHLHLHDGLDALPYFNPDLDRALDDPLLPPAVRAFRAQVAAADAVIISSFEYAHGISGPTRSRASR